MVAEYSFTWTRREAYLNSMKPRVYQKKNFFEIFSAVFYFMQKFPRKSQENNFRPFYFLLFPLVLRTRENNDKNKMTRKINLILHSEAYVNIYILLYLCLWIIFFTIFFISFNFC